MRRQKASSNHSAADPPDDGAPALEFFHWVEGKVAAANAGVSVPCRRGCSYCCYGNTPAVTLADRRVLVEGLAALSLTKRRMVLRKARRLQRESLDSTLSDADDRQPCPLLENEACLVYSHRPLACRLYGFAQAGRGRIYGCDAVRLRLAFTGANLVQINKLTEPFERREDAKSEVGLIDWLATLDPLAPEGRR